LNFKHLKFFKVDSQLFVEFSEKAQAFPIEANSGSSVQYLH